MATPCHKSDLEMQSLGDNNNHVTKTRRRKLRENCLLPQIHHKKFLKIKASGTRDNVRQGTAQVGRNVWLPILLSSAQRKLLLWEILKVLSLTEQVTTAGRMAVSPALLTGIPNSTKAPIENSLDQAA